MTEPLTLLQRAVITRLRQAGFTDLAAAANQHWSEGRRLTVRFTGPVGNELAADFERANSHAISEK